MIFSVDDHLPVSDHFVVHQMWSLPSELAVLLLSLSLSLLLLLLLLLLLSLAWKQRLVPTQRWLVRKWGENGDPYSCRDTWSFEIFSARRKEINLEKVSFRRSNQLNCHWHFFFFLGQCDDRHLCLIGSSRWIPNDIISVPAKESFQKTLDMKCLEMLLNYPFFYLFFLLFLLFCCLIDKFDKIW